MTEADKVTAELMALADAYVNAKLWDESPISSVRGSHMPARAALEQAIRRAVDWEQVAELRGDMKGGGHVHWLSDKTLEPGTPLTGWRPIETAPKNGTAIILYNERRGGPWIGRWHPVAVSGYRFENPWGSLMLNHEYLPNRNGNARPTHWMPLPAAPDAAAPSPGSGT